MLSPFLFILQNPFAAVLVAALLVVRPTFFLPPQFTAYPAIRSKGNRRTAASALLVEQQPFPSPLLSSFLQPFIPLLSLSLPLLPIVADAGLIVPTRRVLPLPRGRGRGRIRLSLTLKSRSRQIRSHFLFHFSMLQRSNRHS